MSVSECDEPRTEATGLKAWLAERRRVLLMGGGSALAAGLAAGLLLQLPGYIAHPPAKGPLTEIRALDPGLARYIKTLAALGPTPVPHPRPVRTAHRDQPTAVEPEDGAWTEAATEPSDNWRDDWRDAAARPRYGPDVYVVVEEPRSAPAYAASPPPRWSYAPPRDYARPPEYERPVQRDYGQRGYGERDYGQRDYGQRDYAGARQDDAPQPRAYWGEARGDEPQPPPPPRPSAYWR